MLPKEEKKKRLTNWLNAIQQDSWQLELIISGVVIFLLIGAYGPIVDYQRPLLIKVIGGNMASQLFAVGYFILLISYFTLLASFLLHLLMRGLWIGAIGLRSVSDDFDFEMLNFQPRFDGWLRRRLGSFDDYIERLENQCSIAFSLSFLLFFCVISLGTYLIFVGMINQLIVLVNGGFPEFGSFAFYVLQFVSLLGYLLGGIYFVDFVTLGWIKKRKWLQRIYFPFYRFMGWVTLARFYRPFYYNLIDLPFGRKLVRWLWVIILAGLCVSSLVLVRNIYFPLQNRDGADRVNPGNYEENFIARPGFDAETVIQATIGERILTRDYLDVFVPYIGQMDNRRIEKKFPGLEPARIHSFVLEGVVEIGDQENDKADMDSLLLAFTSGFQLYVDDSLIVAPSWRFYHHPKREQPGLLYTMPTHQLDRGEHLLKIRKERVVSDSLVWRDNAFIYFYH
jgi:hypothetical protein